ncbi:DNA sulfur modification protein DndB [Nocardioides sp. C4-1]|uniref:DNA sulfur modification protein DndB n=1 Tax=Nocardioides sp. C4-1 TaxID=3151851 RepID=UPI003266EF9C
MTDDLSVGLSVDDQATAVTPAGLDSTDAMASTVTVQSSSQSSGRVRGSGAFEYVFSAIRGVQAGREYYVTMCPMRLIPKLFTFDDEELSPELRAQRTLNKARVPELARYLTDNPQDYVFSALTASVDSSVDFEPFEEDVDGRVGKLAVPMSAKFIINDGQHRRAGIEQALAQNPDLGDETIAIVLFLDVGLSRSQQMFADLNQHAVRPARSIGILYNQRDEMAALTKLVIWRSPLLKDLTEMEKSNLAARSRKLFTLSGFHTAHRSLLEGLDIEKLESRVDLAADYWTVVCAQFPEWTQVYESKVSAGEIRQDFIHSHAIALHALGRVGNSIMRSSQDRGKWQRALSGLSDIDWRRSNVKLWDGRALHSGKVSKSRANVLLTTAAVRNHLGLALPPEERELEEIFASGGAA